MAEQQQELKNRIRASSWKKLEKLGEGRYGKVYKEKFENEDVAVKVIDLEEVGNTKVSIQREEDGMKKLNHPNVLKLLDVQSEGDLRYFVLELCQATLYQYVKKEYNGPVPSDRDALKQMAEGLAHIHENQLVHCDLSPKNILIKQTSADTALLKISDFGLCKSTSESGSHSMSGPIKGTERYVSPELLALVEEDNEEYWVQTRGNFSSDVFALGCLFYYFLTKGGHPFLRDDESATFIKLNIITGKHCLKEKLGKDHFAYKIILLIHHQGNDSTGAFENHRCEDIALIALISKQTSFMFKSNLKLGL